MKTVISHIVAAEIKTLVAGKYGSGEMGKHIAWSNGMRKLREAYSDGAAIVAYTEEFDRCLEVIGQRIAR